MSANDALPDEAELAERVAAMPEEERMKLDQLAYALEDYQRLRLPDGYVVPNRIAALVVSDALDAWSRDRESLYGTCDIDCA